MSEVLAAARAKVEKVKHQDWTSGPDHRYGFREIEIIDHEVTPELLISLKSPNYTLLYLPKGSSICRTKTTYIGTPTEETICTAIMGTYPRPVGWFMQEIRSPKTCCRGRTQSGSFTSYPTPGSITDLEPPNPSPFAQHQKWRKSASSNLIYK